VGRCLIVVLLTLVLLVSGILTGCAGPSEDTAELHFEQGNKLVNQGHYDEAIDEYTKAIELNPNLIKAYNNRATVYYYKEQYDLAIADCSKAIQLDSNYATAYNNRAWAYGGKGQWDLAIADCSRAIDINRDYAEAYYNRGFAHMQQGKKAEAIADFEKFITLTDNPQWIERARQAIEEISK
jgi:tetratricopeptide (TPR) repeat protein